MKFITIIVAVLVYRNWLGGNPIREVVPTSNWFEGVSKNTSRKLRYFLAVVVPVLLLLWISLQIETWFFGLFYLALSIVVLLYSIDTVDLEILMDDQRISMASEQNTRAVKHDLFCTDITYEVFQSIVPSLFWFLLVGPAGALFYILSARYLEQLDHDADASVALQLIYWTEWLPARINGFVYALLGDFRRGLGAFLDTFSDTESAHAVILTNTLRASIVTEADDEEQELLELQWLLERSIWGWVAIAALLTIMGW